MMVATSIAALLLSSQGTAAAYGWDCTVEQDLGRQTEIAISEGVFSPGNRGMTQLVRVRLRPDPGRAETQMLQWSVLTRERALDAPDMLSLEFALTQRVSKAVLKVDYDGGSVRLPLVLPLEPSRGTASVQISDDAVLQGVWRARHWRVSVLDRHGRVQAIAEGGLPGREAVQAAFAGLQPRIDAKVADPGGQCRELGASAWI